MSQSTEFINLKSLLKIYQSAAFILNVESTSTGIKQLTNRSNDDQNNSKTSTKNRSWKNPEFPFHWWEFFWPFLTCKPKWFDQKCDKKECGQILLVVGLPQHKHRTRKAGMLRNSKILFLLLSSSNQAVIKIWITYCDQWQEDLFCPNSCLAAMLSI